jgi:hypothetical protein
VGGAPGVVVSRGVIMDTNLRDRMSGTVLASRLRDIDLRMYEAGYDDLVVNSRDHKPSPRVYVPSLQPSNMTPQSSASWDKPDGLQLSHRLGYLRTRGLILQNGVLIRDEAW